jgi:hypothetical protein
MKAKLPPSWVTIFNRVLCLTALGAFVWIGGAATLRIIKSDRSHLPLEPEISADIVLGRLHATEAAENALRRWREDSAFLLIASGANPNTIKVYYELTILAFPRRVFTAVCSSKPGTPAQRVYIAPPSATVDGLIFYDIAPPQSIKAGRPIAPKLYFAQYEGTPPWDSFCP